MKTCHTEVCFSMTCCNVVISDFQAANWQICMLTQIQTSGVKVIWPIWSRRRWVASPTSIPRQRIHWVGKGVGRWAMMALIKKHEAFLGHYKPFKEISDNTVQSHSANLWRKALLARVCSESADPPTEIWKDIGEEKCEDKYSNTPNTPKLRGHWTCTYIQESYNATVTNWATSYLRLAIKTTSHLRHLKPWLLSKWADAVEVCTIGHVVRGKRVPKNRWGRVRCRPWSLNPLTFQHVVRKGSTFDSCKMSTNFSSLKGDEIQTSVFALHWVFSISLVSPNLQIIPPKKQKLSIRFPSVIGRSPPLLCNQCDALALREGRRFLRFRTWVLSWKVGHHFPQFHQFFHMTFFILIFL